ncbi:hypothetical protein HMPREF9469_02628, partial [, partial [[Clostridium] citroniae WAL-17108]
NQLFIRSIRFMQVEPSYYNIFMVNIPYIQ